MVFEKFEAWTFASPPAQRIFSSAWSFWGERGYQLQSTGGTSFQGRSYQSKIGIHRVVNITVLPADPGATVQVRYRADVRPDVAAGGVVVAVLLLPVAVVGAAVSWHEYERDWSQERWDFWRSLVNDAQAKPSPHAPPPPPPIPPLLSSPAPSQPARAPAGVPPSPATADRAQPSSPSPTDRRPPSPTASSADRCPACQVPVVGAGRFCASCGAPIARR